MSSKSLFIRDNKGSVRIWTITADYKSGCLIIKHGLLGGSMQSKTEYVPFGKVNRSREEQINLQMNSRITKRIQQGYSVSMADANNKPTNALRLPKPMKAQVFTPGMASFKEAYIQRKYDGNRCLIACRNGEVIAYTSNGKQIDAIGHITDNLIIPDDWVLDGELYCHGVKLQTIVSWIKRKQPDTKRLQFMAYDAIADMPFKHRFEMVKDFSNRPGITVAPTVKVSSEAEAMDHFAESRIFGYEGSMLRWGAWGYEDGKRSRQILKLKEWADAEYRVIDVEPSKDGWGILVLEHNNKRFKTAAPGTMEEKYSAMEYKDAYIGRLVTVEYAYLTDDGLPFHPRAKAWRS